MNKQAQIVLAVSALHNFIRMHSDAVELDDWEDDEGEQSSGRLWRRQEKEEELESPRE
jgi:GH24 family phage-related lysozyme (muramidase)